MYEMNSIFIHHSQFQVTVCAHKLPPQTPSKEFPDFHPEVGALTYTFDAVRKCVPEMANVYSNCEEFIVKSSAVERNR